MSFFPVIHRVTVFSGASNTVPLFTVSSLAGAAKPYLFPPDLTPRRIQVPECTGDPGQLRFRVLDKRAVPGDQQDRVFTALLSDSQGRMATRDSLCTYDVSDDGGASYQREFTGRVHEVSLVDKNTLAFSVDDPSVDALFEIFDGTVPTVPWAMAPVFAPMGLLSPDSQVRYGPHPMVLPMHGKVRIDAGVPAYIEPTWQFADVPGPFDWLQPVRDEFLIVTDALQEAAAYTKANGDYALGRHAPDIGVAFRPTGSADYLHFSAAVIHNPIALAGFGYTDGYAIRVDGEGRLAAVGIIDLTGEVALPANGTTGDFYVYSLAPPAQDVPLHIGYTVPGVTVTDGGIHWAVLVSGIAHGAFGGRGLTIDYPRFNAIIQDPTQLKFRFRVQEGPVDALSWMQGNVWPVVGFAPGVTGSGGLYPVSYDPPAVLPSFVFDASNVEEASWAQGRTGQVNNVRIDTVRERPIPPPIADVTSPVDMLREFDGDRIDRYRDLGTKRKAFEIAAKGVRRTDDGDGFDASRQYMIGRADSILDRFQDGPQTLTLTARRTPATKGALVGDHAIEAVPWVPDLETRRRGGTRVMLIVSKGVLPDGRYSFELLDNGPSQFVDAPTVDAVALNAANTKHIVDVTITPPGDGDRGVLEVATTLSGIAAPAQGSGLWMYAVSVSGELQQVVTLPNLASRRGHHFRAIGRGAGKLPSAYSSTRSIITAAIAPPSSVTATTSGAAVLMEWTNGDATYAVMPLLAYGSAVAPSSGFLSQPLPAGSTRFLFTELSPAGAVRVGVKHVDDFGGDSLVAEVAGTVGAPIALAAPRALIVLQGRSENDPGAPRDLTLGIGVELGWSVTEPYASTVLHYASESAFLAPVAISGIAADSTRVLLPLTDTLWYFRAFHQRTGFTASAATEIVSAKVVPLRIESALNDGFAGGYAYLSTDSARSVILNVGSGDPDAERFYYVVSTSAFVEPTAASAFVARAQFPYSASVGVTLEENAYLWGKFWNSTKGFGQGVKHRLSAPVPVDAGPILDEDGGVWHLLPRRSVSAASVIYTVTTDGTAPADPLGSDEGGGPVGTVSTAADITVATTTVDGTRVRVKVKAAAAAGGTGTKSGILALGGTYHAADDRPEVTWRRAVADGTDPAGIEAIELTAVDDSAEVAIYHRVYDEGGVAGAFTRTPASAYDPDPLSVKVEVARPAEGDTRKVLEFYAEDGDGNESAQRMVLFIDGDLIPSGQLHVVRDDATGHLRVLVTSDDPDTGSYRLRVDVDPAGSNGFDDPAFDDGDAAEYSGAWGASGVHGGEEVGKHFTPAQQPGAGEELFVSCVFLRTTVTTAATQAASIASAPVRASAPYNADHKPVVQWDWVRDGESATLTATIADPFLAITALEYNSREGDDAPTGWTAWTGGTGTIGSDTALIRARVPDVVQGKDSEIQARVTYIDAAGNSQAIERSFTVSNWDTASRSLQVDMGKFTTTASPTAKLVYASAGGSGGYWKLSEIIALSISFSQVITLSPGITVKRVEARGYRASTINDTLTFDFWRLDDEDTSTQLCNTIQHGSTGWVDFGDDIEEVVGEVKYLLLVLIGGITSVDNQRIFGMHIDYDRTTGQQAT